MNASTTSPSVSRRTALTGLGAGGLGFALAATGHAAAQDATPGPLAGHPLVGAWYFRPAEPNHHPGPAILFLTADGIVTMIDPLRGNAMGSWTAAGPRSGLFTLVFLTYAADDPTRFESLAVGRSVLEVDAAGDAFTGQAELELRAADGSTLNGPFGPLPSSGTRLRVEPMATVAPAAATPAP